MTNKKRVLLVDDDDQVLETLTMIIESLGREVVATSSGADALTELRFGNVHLVLTDFKMPGMNGVELAQLVQESNPHVPVVIVSGSLEKRFCPPGVDLLMKPFTLDQMSKLLSLKLND